MILYRVISLCSELRLLSAVDIVDAIKLVYLHFDVLILSVGFEFDQSVRMTIILAPRMITCHQNSCSKKY